MPANQDGDGFGVGDRVRIDIPDETDPKHEYHGKNGEIIGFYPGNQESRRESGQRIRLYRVELDIGDIVDVDGRALRPPI